jgi:hypothetical protein
MAEGQWLGHAEGLPIMGFGLGFSKSCPTFMQHNSQKLSTNSCDTAESVDILLDQGRGGGIYLID